MALGAVLGVCCGDAAHSLATVACNIVVRAMQLLGTPLIFFALLNTILETGSSGHMRSLSLRTIRYTIFTTSLAVIVGSIVYYIFRPGLMVDALPKTAANSSPLVEGSFVDSLVNIIPSHIFGVFVEGNVIGAVLLSTALGFAGCQLNERSARILRQIVGAFAEIFLLFARYLVLALPLFLWGFVVLFVRDLRSGFIVDSIMVYVGCLMVTHLVHAFIVLPSLLRWKGFSFIETFRGGMPALMVAAVSKSSSMAVPTTLQTVIENLKVRPAVARFTIPVCSTLNINGCAALILVTTLFMTEIFKGPLQPTQFAMIGILSVFITLGAASVPMGCFFLITSVLSAMDIPTYMMGVILPFFTVFDMLDTSVNVWSDIVITRIIDKETPPLKEVKP